MRPPILLLTLLLIGIVISGCRSHSQKHLDNSSAVALIGRIVPKHANEFQVEQLPCDSIDYFEIESVGDKIVLRGNNGVSIASALYYYLTEFCHCQITWNGTNLKLPDSLPMVSTKIRKESPYQYRYYLNYCTFN